jgi:glycerol-3-phosphate O-acyltransferase
MKVEDKERVLEEMISRVLQEKVQSAFQKKASLETMINETIYHERRRLETNKMSKAQKCELLYWKKVNKRLLNASEEEQKKLLKELITRFAEEIIGRFNSKVYYLVTKIVPLGVSLLLNLLSPRIWFSHFPHIPKLADCIIVQGEVKSLQALDKLGTIILVPTHSTHMDSIAAGFALYKLGLPPYTYGAGLNLFTNPMLSYFMHNL